MKLPEINFAKIKTKMIVATPFLMVLGSVQVLGGIVLSGIPFRTAGSLFSINSSQLAIPASALTSMTTLAEFRASPKSDDTTQILTAATEGLADSYEFYLLRMATVVNGERTYGKISPSYLRKIDLTARNTTVPVPNALLDLKMRARRKLWFAQVAVAAAMLHGSLFIGLGLFGWLGKKKFPAWVMHVANGVVFFNVLWAAVVLTVLSVDIPERLAPFNQYGVSTDKGIFSIVTAWLAFANVIPAVLAWILMAVGKVSMNPIVKSKVRNGSFVQMDEDNDQIPLKDYNNKGAPFAEVDLGKR